MWTNVRSRRPHPARKASRPIRPNPLIPILVGITDTAFVESVNAADYAAKKGASALVLSPPFYYTLSQSAFLGYNDVRI